MEPIAVVIPALDEAAVIGRVVHGVRDNLPTGWPARILVVDNGSRDATGLEAERAGAELVAQPHRGYGRACAAGVRAAAGAEFIVLLDGDGADDPADLNRILAPLLAGEADLVVGVRRRRERGSMTLPQLWGNRLATAVIRILYGTRVGDLGPFRAIRRHDLERLQMSEMTYGWSTEMVVKALRLGLRYREVDVDYRRRVGVSKVGGTLVGSLRAGWGILRTAVTHAGWTPVRGEPSPEASS
ncbi:MAG: glycosyltransferase family 2 protein [Candidatus Dormibacteraceae bacterium]